MGNTAYWPHGTTTSASQFKTNLKPRKKIQERMSIVRYEKQQNQHGSVKEECKITKFLGVATDEEHRPKFLILNVQLTCSNQQYVKEILLFICTDMVFIITKCYIVKMYHKKCYKAIS